MITLDPRVDMERAVRIISNNASGMATPSETWTQVSAESALDQLTIGRLRGLGLSLDPETIVAVLIQQPLESTALRVESSAPGRELNSSSLIVPRTRLFLNRPRSVDIGWDAATAAGVFATTGSLSFSVSVNLFKTIIRTFRLLSEEERDLVIVIQMVSNGDAYDVPASTEAILRAFEEQSDRVLPRLNAMKKRGILIESTDGWRIVR